METLTGACCHTTIRVTSTQQTQFLDITDRLERFVREAGVRSGILNVQTLHTTTAVVINEHEPRLLVDFAAMLEAAVPANGQYRHDDPNTGVSYGRPEPPNGHAHCRALLLPSSGCLNVTDGKPLLGRWQRVFFVELDGPREREVSVMLYGDAAQ